MSTIYEIDPVVISEPSRLASRRPLPDPSPVIIAATRQAKAIEQGMLVRIGRVDGPRHNARAQAEARRQNAALENWLRRNQPRDARRETGRSGGEVFYISTRKRDDETWLVMSYHPAGRTVIQRSR